MKKQARRLQRHLLRTSQGCACGYCKPSENDGRQVVIFCGIITKNNIIMLTTYCLLSTAFFVLYFLFQGLQSVGEKLNDLTRTCESKKPEDEKSFAQRCKRQIEYEKTLVLNQQCAFSTGDKLSPVSFSSSKKKTQLIMNELRL